MSMRMPWKIALGVLTLAIGLPVAYAQTSGAGAAAPPQRWAPSERGPMKGGGWARGRGMRGPGMRGGRQGGPAAMLLRLVNNPALRQRVGITAEQADKIRQQTTDFLKQQIQSRASLQVRQLDLQNLMAAENPDRAAIDKTLGEISALRLAQSKANVDFRLSMRNALTPEQQQKIMQMHQEFMRRGGPGRMGPRGPQGMRNRPGAGPPPPQNPPAEN
jgi:Spy/CpxP family protein refolding chaperone